MTIETSFENGIAVIRPEGSIDSATAEELESAVHKLDLSKVESLTLDFSDVDYISSKCLRILVSAKRLLADKPIIITGLNTTVADIFNLSGLSSFFDIR